MSEIRGDEFKQEDYESCFGMHIMLGRECHGPTVCNLVRKIWKKAGWEDTEQTKQVAYVNAGITTIAALSADHRECLQVKEKAAVIYFSRQAQNLLVRRCLGVGGRGVFVRDGIVYAAAGAFAQPVGPITEPEEVNVLAAVAIAWGNGVPVNYIRQALEM